MSTGGPELKPIYQFAKDAILTETMSVAGRINIIGMMLVFALLATDGSIDVIQALVRIWQPAYHAGNPPLLLLVIVMAGLTFCCTVLVYLVDPLSLSSARRRHS